MEERQIIKSLKEGDREAFSMLYKQYWEKVYHFCGLYGTRGVYQGLGVEGIHPGG